MTAAYGQPFIAPPSPSQYPRVHDIISKNFRPKSVSHHLLLYGMLCNFLTNGSFAMPRSDSVYRANEWPAEYNRRNVVHAQDFLEREGLIKIKKGYRFREDNAKGVSTVVTSTPALEEMIGNVQLRPDADFSANQLITINEVVGDVKKRKTLDFDIIYKPHPKGFHLKKPVTLGLLRRAYKEMMRLNYDYFSNMHLGFTPESGYFTAEGMTARELRKRISENPDLFADMATKVFLTRMFSAQGCGRLYQRHSSSYQNVHREARSHLTVNGMPTFEADYSSMFLNLAYFLCREENPFFEDGYIPIIKELGIASTPATRDAVKIVVNAALMTADRIKCSKAINYNYRETHAKVIKDAGLKVADVYNAFMQVHKRIGPVFKEGNGLVHILMFHESNILVMNMIELMAGNIDSLALHDAAIPVLDDRNLEKVPEIMERNYKIYTRGGRVQVKVKNGPSGISTHDPLIKSFT